MGKLKNIFILGSRKTPQIDFNMFTGELILFGRSIPEDAFKVYEPLLNWVEEYIKYPRKTTNLRLNLEYFNSSTSIWLGKIIRTLSKINVKDSILFIHLYFDKEDFEGLNMDDLKDILASLTKNVTDSSISIGAKTYGMDSEHRIIYGSTIMFSAPESSISAAEQGT